MKLRVRFNRALADLRGRSYLRGHVAGIPPAGFDPDFRHDAACHAATADAEVARGLYRARWPNHCRSCNGWGGRVTEYDPSPPGVSLGPGTMMDFDPCPDCYAHFTCPRCTLREAWPDDSDGDGPCRRCGWAQIDAGDPHSLDPGLPEEWNCWGACMQAAEESVI